MTRNELLVRRRACYNHNQLMNNLVFTTGGDWDSTTLFNNNVEVMAQRLLIELHAGRDAYGELMSGGVSDGGQMTAIVVPQDNPDNTIGIFPGRVELNFPGNQVVIQNTHPAFAFEFTQVVHNGQDITNNIIDVLIDIDAAANNVQAYLVLYKAHWFSTDEVATFNLI